MESKTTSRWGSASATLKSVHATATHIGKQERGDRSAATVLLRRLRPEAFTGVENSLPSNSPVVLVSQVWTLHLKLHFNAEFIRMINFAPQSSHWHILDLYSPLPWQQLTQLPWLHVFTYLRTSVRDNVGSDRAKRLHRCGALPLARQHRFSA